ncbi:MAG: HAD-IB family hydrolase [Actinomycetia bacterium]|nr:HAD-IB family hydrolase [Actinomycetes bacterium]
MELIALFDFDGTLIKKDSMILLFFRYFDLSIKNIPIFCRLVYGALKYFLKIYSQRQFKEIYINLIIDSSRIRDVEALFDDFSKYLLGRILKTARKEITGLKDKGYKIILLSASLDLYLEKVSRGLGFSELICTRTTCNDNKIKITGLNCYGKNKIKMLLGSHKEDRVDWKASYCYSDSESDRELLSLFGNPYIINNVRFGKKDPDFKSVIWK